MRRCEFIAGLGGAAPFRQAVPADDQSDRRTSGWLVRPRAPRGLARSCKGPDFGLAWRGPRVDGKCWGSEPGPRTLN